LLGPARTPLSWVELLAFRKRLTVFRAGGSPWWGTKKKLWREGAGENYGRFFMPNLSDPTPLGTVSNGMFITLCCLWQTQFLCTKIQPSLLAFWWQLAPRAPQVLLRRRRLRCGDGPPAGAAPPTHPETPESGCVKGTKAIPMEHTTCLMVFKKKQQNTVFAVFHSKKLFGIVFYLHRTFFIPDLIKGCWCSMSAQQVK
jgi:hypothetical protein